MSERFAEMGARRELHTQDGKVTANPDWEYPKQPIDVSEVSFGEPNPKDIIDVLDKNGGKVAEIWHKDGTWVRGPVQEVTMETYDTLMKSVDERLKELNDQES